MFTTFSGNTRRPRQVNLSGRKPHAFGATASSGPGPAALNRAQEDRLQRQRDRDALRAVQTLQRLWRGHSTRRALADALRSEWDAVEGFTANAVVAEAAAATPYTSEKQSLVQLQRLVRFASARRHDDVQRLRHYGFRQVRTLPALPSARHGPWLSAYLRLQRLLLVVLDRQVGNISEPLLPIFNDLLDILRFIAQQAPEAASGDAAHLYRTLASIVAKWPPSQDRDTRAFDVIAGLAAAPLRIVTSHTLNAYEAFGCIFMTAPTLSADSNRLISQGLRERLADSVNYKLLANALATLFQGPGLRSHQELAHVPGRLRLLGTFIFFHRYAHNFHFPEVYSAQKDFVAVVSILLNSLPPDIITSDDFDVNQVRARYASNGVNDFLKDQILSLINQEGIGNLLSNSVQESAGLEGEKVDEARKLASYALALLQFFPRKKEDIRLWLYLGPTSGKGSSTRHQAVRYFWRATKRSSIFRLTLRDSRAAIKLLKVKATSSVLDAAHDPSWPSPQQERDGNTNPSDEWRLILVFLELYTFVLKVTDDEEFFSAVTTSSSNEVRENALPLDEVKDLTTFLKNLGFTLYFNATEISQFEEQDPNDSGLTFFNPKLPEPKAQKDMGEPSIGGVAGLSLDYVKGLVTGLLRMVYERDSRRKFLPADHWLMTSRFDMTAFIPAVVQEEEKRNKIEENEPDDVDEAEDVDDVNDVPQLIGTSRTQHQRRLERLQRQQRKASQRRQLQAVAPRLEILQNMPFFIPFTTRVQIFREFVRLDMTKRRGTADPESWRAMVMHGFGPSGQLEKHAAKIRRENEFEDAFQQFYSLGQGLKEPIQITFVDQFDTPEAGIDGGGVTKEFLTSVTSRAFQPTDYIDMFIENDQHLLYPNPAAIEEHKEVLKRAGLREGSQDFRIQTTELLHRYEFLGRIIGKCLYEGILVDVNFAPFFLRKWALTGGTGSTPKETGYRATLNDLRDLDEALYQGLHQLKTYTGDVEDFALNFTVTDNIVVDYTTTPHRTKALTKELQPDGANISVTNQNRLFYISYIARHRLQTQPYQQTAAFLKGLGSMIESSWLSMFNQAELQTLLSGTSSSIDIDDLRRSTAYGGTYVIGDDGLEHPTVQLFWQVMKDLSDGERRAVLKFVTSTPRAPLLGFGTLNPRFSIRDAGNDQERLPSTSTCVNLLKLPMYKEYGVLKEKLLYSVFSGAGFDLS